MALRAVGSFAFRACQIGICGYLIITGAIAAVVLTREVAAELRSRPLTLQAVDAALLRPVQQPYQRIVQPLRDQLTVIGVEHTVRAFQTDGPALMALLRGVDMLLIEDGDWFEEVARGVRRAAERAGASAPRILVIDSRSTRQVQYALVAVVPWVLIAIFLACHLAWGSRPAVAAMLRRVKIDPPRLLVRNPERLRLSPTLLLLGVVFSLFAFPSGPLVATVGPGERLQGYPLLDVSSMIDGATVLMRDRALAVAAENPGLRITWLTGDLHALGVRRYDQMPELLAAKRRLYRWIYQPFAPATRRLL